MENRVEERKNEKGFTLIELLVVVAIIAILAAIAIPQFAKYKRSAYKDAVRSDIKNAVSSIEAFAADYGAYPNQPASCGPGPKQCDLKNGSNTMTGAINVSRDVTLNFTWNQTCTGGGKGYKVEGQHAQLGNTWKASYDSCTGQYTNF